jgi:threonine synthase
MDPRTGLRRRVGDTPLMRAPKLAAAAGLPHLRLKMEGTNPTGTQKDRIARLEVGVAASRGAPGVSVASCGNFGVAIAHAGYVHKMPCHVFVPENFTGERVQLMQQLGAEVHRTPGSYEDAVVASRKDARDSGRFDANPGGPNTLRTLAGYSKIAEEIVSRIGSPPVAVGVPMGNGSTLAGVHLGFHTAWAQGRIPAVPKVFGGTSAGNNPVVPSFAQKLERLTQLDPALTNETAVNEPLVNYLALDGTACLTAIQDSEGAAYGFDDAELLRLHQALCEDGIEAHPSSLAAVAALMQARADGRIEADDEVVAVMTSGRPSIVVATVDAPEDLSPFVRKLSENLGRYGDPRSEMTQAVEAAFAGGFVLEASDAASVLGHAIITPMELSEFFPRYHLSYIAVGAEARGRGVGTMLLEEAIRRTAGDLSLHVDTGNESAIRLYEKFGFHRKYYRMLYQGPRLAKVPTASGSAWSEDEGRLTPTS